MVKRVTMKKRNVKKRILAVRSAPRRARRPVKESNGLLSNLGLAAGTFLGGPVGGQLGQAAGKLISRITGFGDYKISKNSISMGNSVPTFQSGGGGVRICHREFLADVVGSTAFALNSYPINPGMLAAFPWLSKASQNFEEYSLEGLVYEYRPSSGSAVSSTSSALGVVIMATDYDATNPSFTTKQMMESYEYSTSTVPFTGCLHPVECARNQNVLNSQYIRTGSIPVNADLRMFDVGNFQIATQGMQSVYTVGELWVSYDVILRKPRLPPSVSSPAYARLRESPVATASSTNPMGTSGGLILDNYLGISNGVDVTSPYVVLPNVGKFVLWMYTNANVTPTVNGGANVSFGPLLFQDGSLNIISSGGFAAYSLNVSASGTGVNNYLRLGYPSMAGTTNKVDVLITQID